MTGRRAPEAWASLWTARYRTPPGSGIAPAAINETIATLLAHASVRAFLPDALPAGALEAAIAAAQSAATSSNLQAWSVVAIEDPARRARFAALCGNQRHIEQAPVFLAFIADLSRLRRMAERAEHPHEALDYTESFIVAAVDTALAAQNAVAAFESMGLGTVYIGGLRNDPEAVARELDLPQGAFGLFGLCVGHPDPDRSADIKPRLPQAAVLHRDRYHAGAEPGLIAQYDETADEFQREQGLPSRAWSTTMIMRIGTAAGLHGRDRMRSVLARLGFALK